MATAMIESTTAAAGVRPQARCPKACQAAWRHGVRDMLPVLVGIVPFGLAVGHAMGETMSTSAAIASSVVVFAGSAQLTIAQMVGDGAAVLAVVGAVVLVNSRLILFGGAMAPQWKGATTRFRAAAAYLLTDPVFALGIARGERPGTPAERRAYYLGAALTLWVAWQAATAVGMVLGGGVLPEAQLDFVVPLCLVAVLVPTASTSTTRIAALVAAGVALVATSLPAGALLPAATVAGIAAGLLVEHHRARGAAGGAS